MEKTAIRGNYVVPGFIWGVYSDRETPADNAKADEEKESSAA